MIDISDIAETVPLPAAPDGWFDYGYKALMDGTLAIVRMSRDVHADDLRRWEAAADIDPWLRKPELRYDPIRLSVFDGGVESDTIALPAGAYPDVDRTADGRWIVDVTRRRGRIAGALHMEKSVRSGRIYAPDGTEHGAIALGDGVENMVCAPDGTIWIGYIDETAMKGPNADGRWPLSSGGISRLDRAGNPIWLFNRDARTGFDVFDCYAMTLAGDVLWT